MQLLIIYLLHISILSGVIYWLWRTCKELLSNYLFFGSLGIKILAGFCLGWLYQYHYLGGDTWGYYWQAQELASLPVGDFWTEVFSPLESSQPVRAIWFTRGVAALIYLFKVDYWLCSAYFSLISFAASLYALRAVDQWDSAYRMPFFLAFFLIPSMVFWSSGLLKESLGFASMTVLIGFYFRTKTERKPTIIDYGLMGFGFLFLVAIKYYIAGLLMPALFFLWGYRWRGGFWATWNAGYRAIMVGILMLLPAYGFLLFLSPNFEGMQLLEVIRQNHDWILGKTDAVNGLQGFGISGVVGAILDIPYYAFSAMFRPLVFENFNFPAVLSGMENTVFLFVLVWFLSRKAFIVSITAEGMVVLLYVFLCATLLAYSVPNLGTIARYKVYYLPLLFFLVFSLRPSYLNRLF